MYSTIKIAIIPDTNVFTYSKNKTNNLSKLPLEEYYKILKSLELNDLDIDVRIFFPEIVILELIHHLKLKLIKKCDNLEKLMIEFYDFEEITIENNDLDINAFCEELKNQYFDELNIIPIPSDGNYLFNEILKMSIDKKPPFIEGNSDKGFKDSILFLSLLKFAESNRYDKYVIFSSDNGFLGNEKELQNIFKNYLKKFYQHDVYNTLKIIKGKNINSYINDEFGLFKDLKEYLSMDFFNIINNHYSDAISININWNEYDIDSSELIKEDTCIHQLRENEFEVEIFIEVGYYCYYDSFDRRFGLNSFWEDEEYTIKYINQGESYIFTKENDEWTYELESRVYDVDFD